MAVSCCYGEVALRSSLPSSSFSPCLAERSEARDFIFVNMLSRQPNESPVVLVNWYDWTRWVLDRVDAFPKNQRFVFGQRLADHTIDVLELLVEAAYSADKVALLTVANRRIELLRWLVRLAKERKLFTPKQYEFSCLGSSECRLVPACPHRRAGE